MELQTLAITHKLDSTWESSWGQGEIKTSYQVLCDTFGPPNSTGDEYKVQAEWNVRFSDGTRATIYDWKQGDSYNGPGMGILPEQVTNWHIGGTASIAVTRVTDAVSAFLDRTTVSAK